MIKHGSKVRWNINVDGVAVAQVGKVVKILHDDDITGPRRLADKLFPEHKRMFTGWGIPGGESKGYLVEVLIGEIKLIYMPTPSSLALVEDETKTSEDLDSMLEKATYKNRQHPMDSHIVDIHRSSTRKVGAMFRMQDGKGYAFDRNGCIRRTDKLGV